MHCHRNPQYSRPTDPDEIRIVKFWNEKGVRIRRLQHLVDLPELMTIEIAESLAREIPFLKNEISKVVAMSACSQPQFHDIILPTLVTIAKQSEGKSHLMSSMVANDLIKVIRKEDAPIIGDLLLDKNFGIERGMLVPFYTRFAKKNGIPTLLKYAEDNETKVEALKALSMLGETSIKPQLEILANDPNSHYRKIARDGLKRLEKQLKQ